MTVYTLIWHTDERMSQPVAVLTKLEEVIPKIKAFIAADSGVEEKSVKVRASSGSIKENEGQMYEYAIDGEVHDWMFTVREFDLEFKVH